MIEPNYVGEPALERQPETQPLELWQPVQRFLIRRYRAFAGWRAAASAAITLRWASRYAKVDVNAKCPGCGHRQGHIRSSRRNRKIVHRCHVCRAAWCEPFVVNADIWLAK